MPTYMQLGLPLLDNGAMEVSSLIRFANFVKRITSGNS
jgi:hypothetical protein